MTAALARHDAILREAIEGAGGRVVKTTGDGMMAVFPSAARAVSASIAAQVALASEPWPSTGPLRVRMAIHAGEAERRGDDFFGSTINRTARIMSAGHGGQVLLSSAAAALAVDDLPEGASLRDLGEYRLRDIGRPERVFQLQHPRLSASFPPLTTLDLGAASLPAQTATFVGRRGERDDLARRLADPSVRLVTLTGPGGTGKTSLAVRVAADAAGGYRDGVAFVDLSAARDDGAVLLAIGRVLGIGESPDRTLVEQLVDRLRDRQMLLVLDNFEQVTQAAAIVAELLTDCPGVTFLVTSREPLHVRAEHIVPIDPLGLPPVVREPVSADAIAAYDAVQLFLDRARSVRPDFALTDDNAEAVADICRRLDGLPLAIELAASRLRLFSADALRDRLARRLELLRSSGRDLPARHQTLRATIEWSYQLLEADEQELFEILAVFADAQLESVESVARSTAATSELDAVEALASLLEKNLVRQVEASGDEPRFTMLETIREFATERLEASGRSGDVRRAHAVHYTELATRLRRELGGATRDAAMSELIAEVGNLRIALRTWVAERDLGELTRLADTLLMLNEARGWYHDTVELTTTLLAVLADTPSTPELAGREIALRMRLARAMLATQGYTREAEQAYASALERFEGGPELGQPYSVLRGLANLYVLRADFAPALALGERILAIAEAENDPAMRIDGHLVVASTTLFTGDVREGLVQVEAAIALFDAIPPGRIGAKVGNDPRVACLTTSGFLLWLLGSPDVAAARMAAAIELAHRLDDPYTSAYALFHSSLLHLWRREPEIVLDRAIRLLEIADEYDLRIWSAVGAVIEGAAQVRLGQVDLGSASIRSGMAAYQGMITPPIFWPMLLFLDAGASLAAGRPDEGFGPIEQGIEIFGPGSNALLLSELELVRGDLLSASGQAGAAVAAHRTALETARRVGVRMPELKALTRLARSTSGDERAGYVAALRSTLPRIRDGFDTADVRDAADALAAADAEATRP